MHLLFSEINSIKFKKDLRVVVDYNKIKETFSINYPPLNISVESKSSKDLIKKFSDSFTEAWKNRSVDVERELNCV